MNWTEQIPQSNGWYWITYKKDEVHKVCPGWVNWNGRGGVVVHTFNDGMFSEIRGNLPLHPSFLGGGDIRFGDRIIEPS